MDKSKIFKKMCMEANLEWQPTIGMWVMDRQDNKLDLIIAIDGTSIIVSTPDANNLDDTYPTSKENLYPVWHQDQLQEMVKRWNETWDQLEYRFSEFINQIKIKLMDWSFEQLWLAFVMFKKFNKIWNPDKKKWELAHD